MLERTTVFEGGIVFLIFGAVSRTIDIRVDIGVAIDIDINIAIMPVGMTPGIAPGRTDGYTGCKCQCPARYISGRIICWRRIGGIRPGTVINYRTVRRNVHHSGIYRFDDNCLLFHNDFLLRCCLEISGFIG